MADAQGFGIEMEKRLRWSHCGEVCLPPGAQHSDSKRWEEREVVSFLQSTLLLSGRWLMGLVNASILSLWNMYLCREPSKKGQPRKVMNGLQRTSQS